MQAYTYSQLSSHSAGQLAAFHYELAEPVSCQFYVLGLHDNYLLQSGNNKFILRIYRNNWRSMDEAGFELELLAFLEQKTALVAKLVPTKRGELSFRINSPEGERLATLFSYAEGTAPGNAIKADEADLLGTAVANIHNITESFTSKLGRPPLELPYLLDESIRSIQPFVDTAASGYLEKLQTRLHAALPSIKKEAGRYGICIGDVNPTNFHINQHRHITLFDFDQCGYGFRAFDIGKFFSSIHQHKDEQAIRNAFLKGYRQTRQLDDAELQAIPCFEIISVIWVMSIHANNADRIGYKYLEKPFWDRKLGALRSLEARYLAGHPG